MTHQAPRKFGSLIDVGATVDAIVDSMTSRLVAAVASAGRDTTMSPETPIVIDPNLPADTAVLLVTTCACGHRPWEHHTHGCDRCPCTTPATKLAAALKVDPPTPPTPPPPPQHVHKVGALLQISQEQLEEALAWREALAANKARRAAMTQAERDAEDAAWQAQREAEKLARTCQHCGCDPDEHGDY